MLSLSVWCEAGASIGQLSLIFVFSEAAKSASANILTHSMRIQSGFLFVVGICVYLSLQHSHPIPLVCTVLTLSTGCVGVTGCLAQVTKGSSHGSGARFGHGARLGQQRRGGGR